MVSLYNSVDVDYIECVWSSAALSCAAQSLTSCLVVAGSWPVLASSDIYGF